MRITWIIPPPDLSGGIKVVGIYAQKLLERGHDVRVVYPIPPWPRLWRVRTFARRLVRHLQYGSVDLTHLAHLPEERLIACRGQTEVRDEQVPDGDVVVATWWKTAYWVSGFSRAKGRQFHFVQGYESMTASSAAAIEAAWCLPLQKIVISQWLLDLAHTKFNSDATLVPNGVDPRQFDAPPRPPHDPPTVGFLYSPAWWKGPDVALAAIQRARRSLLTLQVISFGTESPSGSFPDIAQFHLRPPQARIRNLYAKSDVWLCTSRSEGFHLPPLEAMACRCPVVSTKVGGPLDCVEDGVNGYLVDVDDAPALADRLIAVLNDHTRWRCMSDAAYETSRRFSWDRSAGLLEQVLCRSVESPA